MREDQESAVGDPNAVTGEAVIEARGLTRSFGEHYALLELNAAWYAGEVCALLGPNGSGKSTLLNLLSTLMSPSEGGLWFEGAQVTRKNVATLRAQIGFVGHATMIYGTLTALENLRFFADLYQAWPTTLVDEGSSLKEAREEWLLDRLDTVGLSEFAGRPASGFSRGMAQRLTLARALLPSPKILLLDEPFTGLDREGIDQVCGLIERERERGATVVLSSHDFETTERLADRLIVLKRGRLRAAESLSQTGSSKTSGALLERYQRSLSL